MISPDAPFPVPRFMVTISMGSNKRDLIEACREAVENIQADENPWCLVVDEHDVQYHVDLATEEWHVVPVSLIRFISRND